MVCLMIEKIVTGPWTGSPIIEVETQQLKPPPEMVKHVCECTVFELMTDGSIVCPRCDVTLQDARWNETPEG